MDKLSYAWGLAMGQQLRGMGVKDLNVEDYATAVKAVFEGTESAIPFEEAQTLINEYLQNLEEEMTKAAREAGEKFLEENAKRANVVTLPSGLQYEIITEAIGQKPVATDKVKVHYHGTLIDGTVFDSSVRRGEPATFGVTQVIQGWVEGLQLMPVGSKWKLYIPYNLAYGEQGAGQMIAPFSALIFEVELLEIVK